MKLKTHTYSGSLSDGVSEREKRNRKVARKAAVEGIVLLKNDGVLPLSKGARVALYGSGALYTVKGGTGSGDVNERTTVNIYEGMKDAGFVVTNEAWLSAYCDQYARARDAWKQLVLELAQKSEAAGKDQHRAFVDAYVAKPFKAPAGHEIDAAEANSADAACAIYVLSRSAGEGADRHEEKGDYYISDEELALVRQIRKAYHKLVLVLNSGIVDLQFADEVGFDAILSISQPGMEGGNAFADIASGAVSPSGRMTDTWAKRYQDYPNAKTFSHCNGNVQQELYEEGIYVGYRYFDTFGVKPAVPFGFGLSYTTFAIDAEKVELSTAANGAMNVTLQVTVRNTGGEYTAKQVVQVYASCPQGSMKKEFQRLCAFGKTPELAPGQSCKLALSFPLFQFASFSEKRCAYILEKGDYVIAVGDSSVSNQVAAVIRVADDTSMLKVEHICPVQVPLTEMAPEKVPTRDITGVPVILLDAAAIPSASAAYPPPTPERIPGKAGEFVEALALEQLLSLTSGDPVKGHGASDTFGSSGLTVPGAAGETHGCAMKEPWNLASIVLADGPAGLRLTPRYQVTPEGRVVKPPFRESIERGFFADPKEIPGSTWYYQYCTGLPVGTMLAQTWNTDLFREIGAAVGEEMEEFRITLWLAPGMNIHRNPLCGRNFEYFSEDPLLSGVLAAAMTEGVQTKPGIGVTIKHLACNNQEDNRKGSDSIVSERALREVYLHGFGIAVKQAQPMAIMPSYNLVNGVHAADSYDLLTRVARGEWGFEGMFVSDWTTTGAGGASAVECMRAGTDLIMPGSLEDIAQLRDALASGELDVREIKKCVANLVKIVWQSLEYEDCVPYSNQFQNLHPYMDCKPL